MSATLQNLPPASDRPDVPRLRANIGWLCHLIRFLMVGYLIWILYIVLEPILIVGAQKTAEQWALSWGLEKTAISANAIYINRAIALISTAALAMMVHAVWNLMTGYLAGDIFSTTAARRLMRVGVTGVIASWVDVLVRPFMFGVMSLDILPRATIYDWVNPVDLMYMLIALFVVALGHIHRTAADISEEHKQFV